MSNFISVKKFVLSLIIKVITIKVWLYALKMFIRITKPKPQTNLEHRTNDNKNNI